MFHKTTGLYKGMNEILYYDQDNSLFLWTYGGNNVITAAVGHPIKLRYDTGGSWSAALTPSGYVYNEHDYYTTTIDAVAYYVWYSPTLNWVISKYLGYGTEEYQEGGVWKGDYWWNGANLTGTTGSPTTFAKRGAGKQAANGKKDYYVAAGQMEGWTKTGTTVPGEYAAISGSSATGTKYAGWKILEDTVLDPAIVFTEDDAQYNNKPTFTASGKSIWYNAGTWHISAAIGTADGSIGYWSCATLTGTYTRTYTGGETAPEPETYTITAKEYRLKRNGTDNDSLNVYMGQVAIWL